MIALSWCSSCRRPWWRGSTPATRSRWRCSGGCARGPRRRAPLELPLSVIVAAHDEVEVIADKVANVLASDYPAPLLELIVASDGSDDGTVEAARDAGATRGARPAAHRQAARRSTGRSEASSGEILVFTDADSLFEPGTLRRLVSNFADEKVGGVAANVVRFVEEDGRPVARGEGLYWRYERLLKRLEDRVGQRGVGQRAPVRGPPAAVHARRPRPPAPTTS